MGAGYSGMVLPHAMKFVKGTTSGTFVLANTDYPSSGSYPDVGDCERFFVVAHLGTVHGSDTVVLTVQQATAAGGTLTGVSSTYAAKTVTAAHNNMFVVFTVETKKLTEDYHYVAVNVAGATNGSYADIYFLLPLNEIPVTQTTTVLPAANQLEYAG